MQIRASSQKGRLLREFARAGHRGLTSYEAGKATGLADIPDCCYWKRVSELAQLGDIELTGEQRLAATGEERNVYRITTAGMRRVIGFDRAA